MWVDPSEVTWRKKGKHSQKGRGWIKVLHLVCGFWLHRFAQKFPCEMSMCISTAQVRTKCLDCFPRFRGCSFTSAPCWFFELCPFRGAGVGHPGHFYRTSFGKTGAGHRTLFHPCGKRANFCTSLKRWQVWVGQNDRWLWRSLCVAHAVFGKLGRRFQRVETPNVWNGRHFWFGTWWWVHMAGLALRMPRAHLSWQAQYFVDLEKSGWDLGKASVFTCSMFFFRGAHNVLWKCNMCTCNPLVTLIETTMALGIPHFKNPPVIQPGVRKLENLLVIDDDSR